MTYEVTPDDMNEEGVFPCPKCDKPINPDNKDYQCTEAGENIIRVIHDCGAEIHINLRSGADADSRSQG